MARGARQKLEWLLLVVMLGGAGFAVARAEPADRAPQYVKFEPVIVPVFIDGRSSGLLSVQVNLEAPNSKERARIEALRPRLIDAYTDALLRYSRLHVDPLAPVDAGAVAAVLGAATSVATSGEPVGEPLRVLVLDVMAQPA